MLDVADRWGGSLTHLALLALFVLEGLKLVPSYSDFGKEIFAENSNRIEAEKWFDSNTEISEVYLDAHYDHSMPRVYGNNTEDENMEVSNAFGYGRAKNPFLRQCFRRFMKDYREQLGIDRSVRKVRLNSFDPGSLERADEGRHVLVVSPSVYNRFINNDGMRYSQRRREELARFKKYYNDILGFDMIKRFDNKKGGVSLEVYEVE